MIFKPARAKKVLRALLDIGWNIKRPKKGSHIILCRDNWPNYTFAFHDRDELGSPILSKIAKHTGLLPGDL